MPKSWDIQPSSKPLTRVQSTTKARTPEPIRRSVPARSNREDESETRSSSRVETHMVTRADARRARPIQGRGVQSLRERRKTRRKRFFVLVFGLLLALSFIVIVTLWQSFLRVHTVEASGPHMDELPTFIQEQLGGTRYIVFPRNSIFFLPTEELRSAILTAYPDIEAISLRPSGLTSLKAEGTGRATAFWWCGKEYSSIRSSCFETDTSGKIFNIIQASTTSASSTPFVLFSDYTGALSTDSPLGGVIIGTAHIGDMLRFVKTVKGLGAPVTQAEIRGDEADLYTSTGTRITYVLGREEQAAALAATAFPSLDVAGSSLLYIDLRFTSKIYFKKKETPQK